MTMAWILQKNHDRRLSRDEIVYFSGACERTGNPEYTNNRMFAERFTSSTAAEGVARFYDLIGFSAASIWG
jgi:hypothetical protein